MNQQQIEWVKSLDRSQTNGTIMSVLLSDNLEVQQFEKVLKFLLTTTLQPSQSVISMKKRIRGMLIFSKKTTCTQTGQYLEVNK